MQIFEESGILKHLEPHDLILADKGFTVEHLVNLLEAKIRTAAFLKEESLLLPMRSLRVEKDC